MGSLSPMFLLVRVVSEDPLKLERVYLKNSEQAGDVCGWVDREMAKRDLKRVKEQHPGRYVLATEITLSVS